MNGIGVVIGIALLLLALEAVFFLAIFRWLSDGRRQRERDFATLDRERGELLTLQDSLRRETQAAHALAHDTVERLNLLGAQVHAEWGDMENQLRKTLDEVASQTRETLDTHVENVVRHRMALEKVVNDAHHHEKKLTDTLKKSERILRFFDKSVSIDDVLKDIQTEKYAEARSLMQGGVDASAIARKLGLSLNEVVLLSHLR